MNFDDYASQVTLKYQVAIATAIIKSKPNNLSITQYINRLRNKIDKMDFDSDVTVCSDDFKFDDDIEVIDDGITFNDEVLNDTQTNDSVNLLEGFNMDIDLLKDKEVEATELSKNIDYQVEINKEKHNTQSTFCEDELSQNLDGNDTILLNLSQHNTNNLENESSKEKNKVKNHFNEDILKNANNTQRLPFDSQETEIYIINNNNKIHIDKPTNITPYKTITPSKVFDNTQILNNSNDKINFNKNNDTNQFIDNTQIIFDSQETDICSYQEFNTIKTREVENTKSKEQTHSTRHKNLVECNDNFIFDTQITVPYSITNEDDKSKTINEIKESNNNVRDNQIFDTQTQITGQDFTENYTHISQSQTQFVEIKNNQLYKTKDNINPKRKQLNKETNETVTQTYENVGRNKIIRNEDTNEFNIQSNNTFDRQNVDFMTLKDIEAKKLDLEKLNCQMYKQNDEEMDEIEFIDNLEIENSQFEIVPFKVIEELNRLKIYLERKNKETDGSWSDSGYKSDSQSRSSFKSHQQSQDTLINHSARCLLDFILKSPLVLASKEIVIEISWVLGRLIDKLYVEEKYFLVLEEILSTIDNLLKDIYEGESYDEEVIHKKDSNINSLFLLNRSNHIIKYTIEKITIILENYLSQLTNDLLEINNTKETENLSYILHILECLLKRYKVIKNQNTQTYATQNTQEEKYLKKSTISDIWRKKWNPNHKISTNDSLVDKKSIDTKCMEVLNKIIVQSMEGYSLISFAALQCFNLLQS